MMTDILFEEGSGVDADELVRAAMRWHFDDATGSPFWLERRASLGFDPRSDVRTVADLLLFPNVVDQLRDAPVRSLIPRGYGDRADIVAVVESGATTGSPKRLPLLRDFAERMASAEARWLAEAGASRRTGWLSVFPSGPHGALDQMRRAAAAFGEEIPVFAVDLDPRWVKRRAELGDAEGVAAYSDHVIAQVAAILESQDVSMLRITPPLLARLVRDDRLVELVAEKIRVIVWGGAHLDADSRDYYRHALFPDATILGRYGTTMALGAGCVERVGLGAGDACVMDASIAPHAFVEIRDADSGRRVDVGERGQVVFHLVTGSFLLPNNPERDSAVRLAAAESGVGDVVADVRPLASFGGKAVVEGVY